MHPILCAVIGIAAGLAYLGMKIWLTPGKLDPHFRLTNWGDFSATLAVVVGSTLWMHGQKARGLTTQRRINSAYNVLVFVVVVILVLKFSVGDGWFFYSSAALLLTFYLWKAWQAGRRPPGA